MSVKKKTENLTIEEKLVQALVPECEQPYTVPKNWCWVRLGNLIATSKEKTDDFTGNDLKYVGLEHIEKDNGIIGYSSAEDIKSLKNVFRVGQILYGKLRPYLNKHDIAYFCGVCSTDILVFNSLATTIPQYVNYYLNQQSFIEYAASNSKGINLPRVSENIVLDALCPLPPLAEQHRIVERIENLFAKLDEAKDKLQETLDGFEVRKAAILHKAFSGELTTKWREENGVSLDSWEHTNLGKYATSQYGFTESATDAVVGPKFLRITDIQNGKVNWEKVPYCKIDGESKDKYKLNIGDIVVARTGATTGKCYLIVDDVDSVFASFLIRISVDKSKIDTYYLYWFMQSQQYWFQITELSAGIAQPGVNGRKLVGLNIPIPTIEEQIAIVNLLNNEFVKEAYVKTQVECVFKEIDSIKKSILGRAFRGELGTNDENEESSVELLKTIL